MGVKKLRGEAGMTQTQFIKYFGIPKRTVQSWEYGERKCPEYLLALMRYKLKKEGLIKGE